MSVAHCSLSRSLTAVYNDTSFTHARSHRICHMALQYKAGGQKIILYFSLVYKTIHRHCMDFHHKLDTILFHQK